MPSNIVLNIWHQRLIPATERWIGETVLTSKYEDTPKAGINKKDVTKLTTKWQYKLGQPKGTHHHIKPWSIQEPESSVEQ